MTIPSVNGSIKLALKGAAKEAIQESSQRIIAKSALKGVKLKKKIELEETRKRKAKELADKAKHVARNRGGAQPIMFKGN